MSTPLACVVCSVDPQTTSLILPLAQATIVAAPVILRRQIGRGVRALRARRSKHGPIGHRGTVAPEPPASGHPSPPPP